MTRFAGLDAAINAPQGRGREVLDAVFAAIANPAPASVAANLRSQS